MTVYNRRIALKQLLLDKMNEIAATKSDLKEAEKMKNEFWDSNEKKIKNISYYTWADKHTKLKNLLPDLYIQLYEVLDLLFEEDSEWFLEERYSIK